MCIASRACLNQFLIVIWSSFILCDHIWLKTRLIAIMNLITTLGMSLLPHTACYCTYKQDTGRGGRWGVVSQMQQQPALCSVLCWSPLFPSSPAKQSSVTATHWPPHSNKRTSDTGLTTGWLKQSQLPPLGNWPTARRPSVHTTDVTLHSGLLRQLGLLCYTRWRLWSRPVIAISCWWCHDHRSLC